MHIELSREALGLATKRLHRYSVSFHLERVIGAREGFDLVGDQALRSALALEPGEKLLQRMLFAEEIRPVVVRLLSMNRDGPLQVLDDAGRRTNVDIRRPARSPAPDEVPVLPLDP